MKKGDCIRCGWCCIDYPCGLSTRVVGCEFLVKEPNGQYTCTQWPFTHLDIIDRVLLAPGQGCTTDGSHKEYMELFNKLKENMDEESKD